MINNMGFRFAFVFPSSHYYMAAGRKTRKQTETIMKLSDKHSVHVYIHRNWLLKIDLSFF